MIVEFENNGAKVIVSGENLVVSVTESGQVKRRTRPRELSIASARPSCVMPRYSRHSRTKWRGR